MKYLSTSKRRNSNQSGDDGLIDRRLTAIGCQNGWVGVYLVNSEKNGKSINNDFF